MLEAKYYKDLSHNYLILKSTDAAEGSRYQNKMLTGNRIRNLLSCSIRNINNEIFFYYEISSLQSIGSLYKKGGMSYKQLFNFFEYLYEASKQVKEYLLQDSYILLAPEYIYANPEGEKYYFVYFPYAGEEISLLPFAEFLLEAADREDEKTVETVYRIYELIQDGSFILPEVLQLFDETHIRGKNGRHYSDTVVRECPDNGLCNDSDNDALTETDKSRTEIRHKDTEQPQTQGTENEIWGEGENSGENSKERSGNFIVSAVFLFLCIAAITGIFCIRYFCLLSVEEELLTIAGIVSLVLAAAFLVLYLITFPVRVRTGYKEKNKREGRAEYPPQRELYLRPVDKYTQIQGDSGNKAGKSRVQEAAGGRLGEEVYGNTVFLEASLFERENKLYGVNKGNKYHIDLDKIPCTVGKMAGGVDIAIKDDSISRIHACFSKEGEEICVTDLNSTNGTFKNGLRLEPNETTAIEPGDELRFGKMTFCYR